MTYRKNIVHSNSWIARLSFWMIRFMHDNFLLRLLRNPYRMLESLGLKRGQKVLEVGCGPGFFTLPAVEIVGKEGYIYALDVNPFAVKCVSKKITKEGIAHAKALHANAADTGLPDHHIDLAFFIGVPHVAGGMQPVLRELNRVLKPSGRISFHLGRWSEETLVEEIAKCGFALVETSGPIRVFRKSEILNEPHE